MEGLRGEDKQNFNQAEKNPSANKEAMQNLYLIGQGKSVSPGE